MLASGKVTVSWDDPEQEDAARWDSHASEKWIKVIIVIYETYYVPGNL